MPLNILVVLKVQIQIKIQIQIQIFNSLIIKLDYIVNLFTKTILLVLAFHKGYEQIQ